MQLVSSLPYVKFLTFPPAKLGALDPENEESGFVEVESSERTDSGLPASISG